MLKKKIVWLLVVMLMVSSLFMGCSSNKAPENTEPANNDASTEKPAWSPDGNIEMVVPFNAGGGSDIMARTIHKIITDKGFVSSNMNVVNKPGGSGSVGYAYLAQQKGNPLYVATTSVSYLTAPILGNSPVSYKDFTHVANLAIDSALLFVRADSEIQSFEQLMEELRNNPGKYTIGGVSGTSDDYVMTHQVKKLGKVDIEYVPFQGGGETMTALLGGHIDLCWGSVGEAANQLEAGKIRPLVAATKERLPGYDDVPTLIESGINASFAQYRGVVLPGDVPQEAVEYWENVIKQLVETEEWKEGYIKANALTPYFLSSEEFEKTVVELSAQYEEVFTEMGAIKK